jgi:hypothetical protein
VESRVRPRSCCGGGEYLRPALDDLSEELQKVAPSRE